MAAIGKLIMHPTGLRADRPHPSAPVRLFRYQWELFDASDRLLHRSVTYEVVDQWDGSSSAACVALEADLHAILPTGCSVTVSGGYVS